jgi:lysophospholipase L1-like esterase
MNKFTGLFKKEHFFSILLLCSSIVAALVVAETILRFALPANGFYVWPPHLQRVFKPYQDVMPGISGESRFESNSLGIRGDEPRSSHTYRILAIGGSTTECLYLDQFETWPYLLQKTLNENAPFHNVWVGNAGMGGRTTRHHLTAMRYLPLKEMRVDAVIFLVGFNDFSKRLSQDESYDPHFLARPGANEKLVYETFRGTSMRPYTNSPFFKKTALWQMLMKAKEMFLRKNIEVQDEAGRFYVTWRELRQGASEIRNELPKLSSALEEYARNINMIIDVAQQKSVRLIFLTQPTMWKPGLSEELSSLLWGGRVGALQQISGKPYYSVEALEIGMKRYNEILLNICQTRGMECIDLSDLEKDTTVFYDDAHFNESGARKISMVLSNHILGREPFRGVVSYPVK